ncbi:hypothetical protein H0266_15040 [Halobacillus locisalis]|uniref:Uncharacterized protein n=1 Tax=Halobacillus locisalis TaxID=220753 RepID=A0A838CWC2_9BACI|nr:hypothetical protein [Halobacillus locisalis]MBA2176211.1 hypothetical protein [Halobacillus locisalis]
MKKFMTNSYISFWVSILTLPFFFLLIKGFLPVPFHLGVIAVGIMIAATYVCGIMACFREDERNSLAVISFLIGAVNVFVFGTGLLMSQMA